MKVNLPKITILIVPTLAFILLFGAITYFYLLKESPEKLNHSCLSNDEIADYSAPGESQEEQNANKGYFATSPVTIYIKDKATNMEKYNFQIDNNSEGIFTLQLFQCNIYVTRIFNFDFKKWEPLEGYKTELWRFHYDGSGEPLLVLFKKEDLPDNLSQSFRIDPYEKYIVFERGYLGSPSYALAIKDLQNLNDVFTLPIIEIEKQNPEIVGSIMLNEWSRDGRYFWANTHYGAMRLGFIRIDIVNWKTDILPAPENVLGGDALNVEKGYITVHPGNVWFGIAELTEEEKARRRAQGIGTELYIYNLFTGERQFVDKIDEPLWYFQPKWISDIELEYVLPSGEKKIYIIKED